MTQISGIESLPRNRGMTETQRKQSSAFKDDDVGRFSSQTSRLRIPHTKYRNTANARNVKSEDEEAVDGIDDGIGLDGAPARRSSSRETSSRKGPRSASWGPQNVPLPLGVKRKVI